MLNMKHLFLAIALITFGGAANAATTKVELNQDSDAALQRLIKSNPVAADLSHKAKAVLIFPNIVKAGLVFGGAFGEGELKLGAGIDGYYNSITASWGLQAGAQSYGYVVFLMNQKAVDYVHKSDGWEIGVGPTVAIIDAGAAKNFSTTTEQKDAYAFIFDQQGLMASLSLEGTKISRIKE